MIFMFLGIFLANAAMELGLLRYISKPLEPLTKAAKLPHDAAIIPAIFLFNAPAAHAPVASLLNNKIHWLAPFRFDNGFPEERFPYFYFYLWHQVRHKTGFYRTRRVHLHNSIHNNHNLFCNIIKCILPTDFKRVFKPKSIYSDRKIYTCQC